MTLKEYETTRDGIFNNWKEQTWEQRLEAMEALDKEIADVARNAGFTVHTYKEIVLDGRFDKVSKTINVSYVFVTPEGKRGHQEFGTQDQALAVGYLLCNKRGA